MGGPSDLKKVVKCPQVENAEIYNVLKKCVIRDKV